MEAITEPRKLALEISRIITEDEKRWEQAEWTSYWPERINIQEARNSLQAGSVFHYYSTRNSLQAGSVFHCYSTCCVAGWAAILSAPAGATLSRYEITSRGESGEYVEYVEYLGRDALGLNNDQAAWLFHPYRTREQVLWALEKIAAGADWDPGNFR